ncbi:peptidase C14, partial [Armillaria gallica]
ASRVWAVLIGINVYSSSDCSPLRGCVNDVETVVKFLVQDLGMSEENIKCLLKRDVDSPTRDHIIDALLNLSTKPEIQYGDNIIIYFAGHGSSYKCSDYYIGGGTSAEGYIEALCPMDRNASGTDLSTDSSIPDISDREINTILTEICRTKGPHITFILDC